MLMGVACLIIVVGFVLVYLDGPADPRSSESVTGWNGWNIVVIGLVLAAISFAIRAEWFQTAVLVGLSFALAIWRTRVGLTKER